MPPQRDTKSDEIYIKTDAIPRAGRDELLLIRVLYPGENIALSGTRSDEQELIPTELPELRLREITDCRLYESIVFPG